MDNVIKLFVYKKIGKFKSDNAGFIEFSINKVSERANSLNVTLAKAE